MFTLSNEILLFQIHSRDYDSYATIMDLISVLEGKQLELSIEDKDNIKVIQLSIFMKLSNLSIYRVVLINDIKTRGFSTFCFRSYRGLFKRFPVEK